MYGRIPDEKQVYTPGDTAIYKNETKVEIDSVHERQVYYEHRPIASYTSYLYAVVDEGGTRRLVEVTDLSPLEPDVKSG